jgi:ferrous iron transport protein B
MQPKPKAEEILQRYSRIKHILQLSVSAPDPLQKTLFTEKLDNLCCTGDGGYPFYWVVLFLLFQS